MFHVSRPVGKSLVSILIGFVFCAIIWASPESTTTASALTTEIDRPVLIIDPGHGGEDGGAVSLDGTLESSINLDIGLLVRDLCHFVGIPTVMTRESQILEYPSSASTTAQRKRWDTKQRVDITQSTPNGILLSIHQNIYPTPVPRGAQVLYGTGERSICFGKKLHNNLVSSLDPSNRRVAVPAGKDIYIMSHAGCTAVLVECGFLSNPEESVLLNTNSYKLKIATVLTGSTMQFMEDTNESKNSVLLHRMRQ